MKSWKSTAATLANVTASTTTPVATTAVAVAASSAMMLGARHAQDKMGSTDSDRTHEKKGTTTMLIHADFSTGASGDKILGALLGICERLELFSFEDLETLADALVPGVRIERSSSVKQCLRGTHLEIIEDTAPVRSWATIARMIEEARANGILTEGAAARAHDIFLRLAQAEADVHGCPLEEVHFHEVGAADSIVDIVGCAVLLDKLAVGRFYATPLALGSGTVECAHGTLPVPAPATARLVKGLPTTLGAFSGELTTPTGAAIAAVCVTDWAPLPNSRPRAIGYGAGSRELEGEEGNVVRIIACEEQGPLDGLRVEQCMLLETNIDHLSAETLSHVCDKMLDEGALDVWQQAITMKKGRLGILLSVLCRCEDVDRMAAKLVAESGTLGMRRRLVERTVAPRAHLEIDSEYGPLRCKAWVTDDPIRRYVWVRPEHDELERLAVETGIPYMKLQRQLSAQAEHELTDLV